MATHDYIISNASGAAVRSDLNNALAAIVSNNSAATEPTTTYAYMWWADTTAGQLKLRNAANDGWVTIQELDGTLLMEDGTVGAPGLAFASDLDTGFYRPAADELGIATGGTNAIYIDDAQQVGIGTTSPSRQFQVENSSGNAVAAIVSGTSSSSFLLLGDTADDNIGQIGYSNTDNALFFDTNGSERARIDSSGNVGIGTINPSYLLHLANNGTLAMQLEDTSTSTSYRIENTSGDLRIVESGVATRMRLHSDGNIYIGRDNDSSTAAGTSLFASGFARHNRDNNAVMILNRGGTDGAMVNFQHAGTTEGSISVSGTTVSYNGAHLSRWSQLPVGVERTEILRGSVLSNIDEMCEWAYEAEAEVLWTEEDELPEGVNVGDVKTPAKAAGTEDNEQLNRMQVSNVEGDRNVAGVFQSWDDDDDIYTNDFYCAMTGDFVIRIAEGVTVERGDLLMSAGDGTAKPQEDDIIRSKTIAKVTSTHVSATYDDGSYCVPCVLMAC